VNAIILISNGAELGESTNLICESNNSIRTWYKSDFGQTNDNFLVFNGTENRVYIFNTQLSAVFFRSVLTIDFVVESDFGTYKCIDSEIKSAWAYFSKRIKIFYF
jgi:hypothetical protein